MTFPYNNSKQSYSKSWTNSPQRKSSEGGRPLKRRESAHCLRRICQTTKLTLGEHKLQAVSDVKLPGDIFIDIIKMREVCSFLNLLLFGLFLRSSNHVVVIIFTRPYLRSWVRIRSRTNRTFYLKNWCALGIPVIIQTVEENIVRKPADIIFKY